MTTYWRLHPDDEAPEALLEPENQVSKPWGGADKGPCGKCHESGRLQAYGDCPTCRGTGAITESERRGVSVFPDPDEGALLVFPTKIVRAIDLDRDRIAELKHELARETA